MNGVVKVNVVVEVKSKVENMRKVIRHISQLHSLSSLLYLKTVPVEPPPQSAYSKLSALGAPTWCI